MADQYLTDIIEDSYIRLVSKYNLTIVLKNKMNIIFKSEQNYALWYVFYDHFDGNFFYVDTSCSNLLCYDILDYFFKKRRQFLPEKNNIKDKNMNKTEYWGYIFTSNSNVLLEGGKDILSGDKEWLKEITWTKGVPVSPEIIPYLKG